MIVYGIEFCLSDKYVIQLSDIINCITAIATFGLAIFAIFQIRGIKNGNKNVIKTNLTNYETEIVKINFDVRNISSLIDDEISNKNSNKILVLYDKQDKYIDELFLMTDSLCFYLLSLSKRDKIKKLYHNRINKIYNEYKFEIHLENYLNIKQYLNIETK
jgi:hypothetical protein